MSNSVFPSLPGMKWNQQKTPVFSTMIQRSTSGREARASYYQYPVWIFDRSYELLRDDNTHNELKMIMGFYLSMYGAFDSFLFVDDSDSSANNQAIGTGNGTGNNFQMIRTYGANGFNFIEPILNIQANSNNTPINVYINGNLESSNNYSINLLNSGILTFVSPPANGANVSATFSYYFRVRFAEYTSSLDSPGGGGESFSQFMHNLWELKSMSLISVR